MGLTCFNFNKVYRNDHWKFNEWKFSL